MKKLLVFIITLSLIAFTVPAWADVNQGNVNDGSQAGASSSISTDSHDNIKSEATKARPNSGPVPIPGQPGWFTTPTPDGSFQSLKTLLDVACNFTEGALENMAAGGSVLVNYKVADDTIARASADDAGTRWIKIVLVKPEKGDFVAFANGEAKNGKTNSVQVMAAVALKAIKDGANIVYFSAEGAHRKVEAFGWGVGFSQVHASQDNMSTGGMGISGGEAGPEDRPWLQGFAFVAK